MVFGYGYCWWQNQWWCTNASRPPAILMVTVVRRSNTDGIARCSMSRATSEATGRHHRATTCYTADKMTHFWARFKQNCAQNPAIREILAKYYRITPQNCAELAPSFFQNYYYNSLIRGLFDTDSFMSYVYEHHCFIGIFLGPLNTNCIKYQANKKWAKLELSLSCGKFKERKQEGLRQQGHLW